ncbi:hypothetical protein Pint_02822 [Pistacia integerrima]|uniref:Uncharacterized protein n=1 Tax=Pistacia integerrima TaxID=434235 RepID=A0ACC0ZMV4_9ROSI|nr:hypothetical protein Pint_02822 [Pistacia integerrima]
MTTTTEDVIAKTQMLAMDENLEKEKANCENGATAAQQETNGKAEEVAMEVEPNAGVSFPVKLDDGKQLNSVGLRKKSMLGIGIKIYGYGMYADNEKLLKDVLKSKIGKAPAKPTEELYKMAIDSDLGMTVRLVIVSSNLTMSMVRKFFDEGLGASIKKLSGEKKNDELANKVMGQASDDIKLPAGSVIEISRLPGHILETKVKDELVSRVASELLCRAYINVYLGDDPLAKEKFGTSMLSLF